MNEYEKRKAAITRHQSGESIIFIVNSLGKPRKWFYNWMKRYQMRIDENSW